MLVTKKNITSIIPQRFPMIMIDNLLEQKGNYSVTNFEIDKNNIFVNNGEFHIAGIIENMAQTAGAGAGYHFLKLKIKQPLTFIGSIGKLKINNYPSVGSIIETKVEVMAKALNITLIKAFSFFNNEVIAECEMKIVSDNIAD